MAVILCSFAHVRQHARGRCFSVARWQPRGCHYPTLWFLAPFRKDGSPILMMPPEEYRKEYLEHVLLGPQRDRIVKFVQSLRPDEDVTLLCWCNAERQRGYPRLMCHTLLIGYLIQGSRPDVEVLFLDGRERPVWEGLLT